MTWDREDIVTAVLALVVALVVMGVTTFATTIVRAGCS